MSKLEVGVTGTYEELSSKDNPDKLIVAYAPLIDAMLDRAAAR